MFSLIAQKLVAAKLRIYKNKTQTKHQYSPRIK